jgi:hypothetical protein
MRPHRPGLVLHTFLLADPAPAAAVRSLWEAVAGLGLDAPIGRWPVEPAEIGGDQQDRPFRVLAGRQRLETGSVHQALLYRVHDVIGVSVQLAPNDDRVGWDRLHEQWTTRMPAPPPGVLGTVSIDTALVPGRRRWFGGRSDRPESLARSLAPHVAEPVADWADAWCRTDDGVLTWELPPDETLTHRRLLAVTGARNEPAMDDWTWTSDRPGLPPLTRYLLHAAKVRDQNRVLEDSLPRVRAAIARAERSGRVLDDLLSTDEPPLAQLQAADRALSAAQTDESGLIIALGDVRDMIRTVQVADQNMAAALAGRTRSAPDGLPAVDRNHAAWLIEQLRTEETYLESAHRRTREVGRLAGAAIDQRQRQRQESLTLVQTSVLGALLMALGAIQSFTYKIPLPGPLFAPVICLLATVALLLPFAVLRRPGGPDAPRRRWPVVAGSAGIGAALGWLGTSLAWVTTMDHAAPAGWSVAISAVAGAVLAAVAGAVV